MYLVFEFHFKCLWMCGFTQVANFSLQVHLRDSIEALEPEAEKGGSDGGSAGGGDGEGVGGKGSGDGGDGGAPHSSRCPSPQRALRVLHVHGMKH